VFVNFVLPTITLIKIIVPKRMKKWYRYISRYFINMNIKTKYIFTKVYEKNLWGESQTITKYFSGKGTIEPSITKYEIILVRGAPAVGKSSLGRKLRKKFPEGVVVEVDTIRGMINSVNWVQKEEYMNALRATEKLCKSYFIDGYKPIIIIGPFTPSSLQYFVDLFNSNKLIVVSLYAINKVLKHRLDYREKGFKDWDITKIVNDEVKNYRHPKELLLNTTDLNKDQVVDKFIALINEKGFN